MKKNHISKLLPAYLDQQLNEVQHRIVEAHLATCATCTKELEEFRLLLNSFKKEPVSAPSDSVRANFLEQLELEKQQDSKVVSIATNTDKNKSNWSSNLLKIAAGIALLVGAFFFGKQRQAQSSNIQIAQLANESQGLKQTAMLSLMGSKSASKRIQGVSYIEEFDVPDDAIVNALADRMLHDENTNVRRTAVEVLSEFTASETVKSSFIKALKTEKDPGIQISIIQVLGKIQEKKAVAPMKYLLDQEDTQPYVKDELKSVISTII